jgi:hypothetical protein
MSRTFELDPEMVAGCALAAFPAEHGFVVYADRRPRQAGAVQVGSEIVTITAPAVLVFRDEQPGANWMHQCSYALVTVAGRQVLTRVAADRPPVFGILPSSWIVVSDPDEMADLVETEQK